MKKMGICLNIERIILIFQCDLNFSNKHAKLSFWEFINYLRWICTIDKRFSVILVNLLTYNAEKLAALFPED